MPKPDKVAAVKEIAEALQATDVYYFVDYRGLTFAEATDLRARLGEIRREPQRGQEHAGQDRGGASRGGWARRTAPRPHGNRLRARRRRKGGQDHPGFHPREEEGNHSRRKLQRSMLTASDVESLAALPSREQLMARALGAIAGPLYGLANVMNAPLRGMAVVLGQVQEQKSKAA